MNAENPLTAYRIELVRKALASGPLCTHDLAPLIFLSYGHAWRLVKFMHEQRLIYIRKWQRRHTSRVYYVASYMFGAGMDAQQPSPLTGAQKQARCIHKARQNGDKYALIRAKDRACKRKIVRDPLVSAMFGSPVLREVRHGR